jgi:hypothetical protein
MELFVYHVLFVIIFHQTHDCQGFSVLSSINPFGKVTSFKFSHGSCSTANKLLGYSSLGRIKWAQSFEYDNYHQKSFCFMGKGDGKKRRKPKKSAPSEVESVTPLGLKPPPQRVSTQLNIPVRYQIRWGQMKKEIAKSSSPSFRQPKVVQTKYRRTWGKSVE